MTTLTKPGYDVIGDVHGHLDALVGLLTELGYAPADDVWRRSARTAVFVGDLVDGGAPQIGTFVLVRAMVDAGTAQMVLGNHEYNAIAWMTPNPHVPGAFVRTHDLNHFKQHEAFLKQVGADPDQHHRFIDWFTTLPLWLELRLGEARLRVVHACWDLASMDVLRPYLSPTGALTTEAVVATRKDGPAYWALEHVLKGPEVEIGEAAYVIPDGSSSPDSLDGLKVRHRARRRWWDPGATTLDRVALIPSSAVTPTGGPVPPLPATPVKAVGAYYDTVPLVVGHYWASPDEIELYSPYVACVDYSVAKGGPLVAYRWSGEDRLDVSNYVVHHVDHARSDEDLPEVDDE